MIAAFYTLSLLVILVYGFTNMLYWRHFFDESNTKTLRNRSFLIISLILHGLLLLLVGTLNNRFPVATPGEWLLVCTWLVGVAYVATEIISNSTHLGLFSLIPTGLGVLLAVIMLEPQAPLTEKYRGALFSFHVAVSLAAFACFTIAAIMAAMYAMLFKKLKKKQFDVFFRRLPSLGQLEQHTTIWVYFGILFIVLSPAIGRAWVNQYSPGEGMSPKEWGILLVAITFLTVATARMFFKFRGFRFMASIIFCFIFMLLTQIFRIHGF
jgi:ABC-type uncharacterized transport system permease subunit